MVFPYCFTNALNFSLSETILDKEINRLKSEIENQAKQKNKKIEEYIKEINY